MTPYEIGILIHTYAVAEDYKEGKDELFHEVIGKFLENDIICNNPGRPCGYDLTEKGELWLNDILSTPMPVRAFIDSRGKVTTQSETT